MNVAPVRSAERTGALLAERERERSLSERLAEPHRSSFTQKQLAVLHTLTLEHTGAARTVKIVSESESEA